MWTKGYIVGHTVTHYSFHNEIFSPFSILVEVARVEDGYQRRGRLGYII